MSLMLPRGLGWKMGGGGRLGGDRVHTVSSANQKESRILKTRSSYPPQKVSHIR